jgi:hypothetical protein
VGLQQGDSSSPRVRFSKKTSTSLSATTPTFESNEEERLTNQYTQHHVSNNNQPPGAEVPDHNYRFIPAAG